MEKQNDPLATEIPSDILIVDDRVDNLRLLSSVLSESGHKVRKVINGELAIDSAKISPPDLILLDIMMPGIDGYEVCRRLKDIELTREIPIIFLSAKDEALDKVQAFGLGGVDYITKPFKVTEVLARVENQLKISRLQKQLQGQNLQLKQEIRDRIAAEKALQSLNQQLEYWVQERTAQLEERNQQLLALQVQLEEALTREQTLSQLKSQLITTISHQFRTPLAIIASSVDLIKMKGAKVGLVNCDSYYQKIEESVKRITQMLEDVLMLARLNSNDIKLQLESLHLTDFCREIFTRWKLPENSQHELIFSSQGEPPHQIYADSHLLQRILAHLLRNAISFSPKGGKILLELIYESTSAILRLHDQGIGIPQDELEKVCDRFYRASNANSIPGTPGAGLGLAIVKWAVEMHGGTLAIESELNQGTTVVVSLPLLTSPQG